MASYSEENSVDFGLTQGNEYHQSQKTVIDHKRAFNISLLEESTMPGVTFNSIVEGLENITVEKDHDKVTQHMKDLEAKFNATLSEYTTLYRQYLQKVSDTDKVVQSYRGKNILHTSSGPDSSKYNYVNKYGYTRAWTNKAWDNAVKEKPAGCDRTVPGPNTSGVYDSLQHGSPMGVGEPCGLEGQNV